MSSAAPTSVAVVLPPWEGFGPRRARGVGLTVRHHSLATTRHRTVVHGGNQAGPVFLDVTYRLVKPRLLMPGTMRVRYTSGLLRAFRQLRPALIEVHAEPTLALWLQFLFPSVPVVLVAYEDPAANRSTRTPARRSALFNRLARVVVASEWLRDRFLDGVAEPPRAPVVVPPCIDRSGLPASSSEVDLSGGSRTRRNRVVLFVGRLVPEKGPDLFISACIAALPSLPGWRAEMIGAAEHVAGGPETPFMKVLRATAEPAGISMMGYRDHPDVMLAMARAAIVVLPSRVPEPNGRTVLEAMGNGAAVICSPEGANAEIGGDVAIYAKPAELADAIRALGADPKRLAALSDAGRQRAARYDLPLVGRLVDEARARIIAEWPPRKRA